MAPEGDGLRGWTCRKARPPGRALACLLLFTNQLTPVPDVGRGQERLPQGRVGETNGHALDDLHGRAVRSARLLCSALGCVQVSQSQVGLPELGRIADLLRQLQGARQLRL